MSDKITIYIDEDFDKPKLLGDLVVFSAIVGHEEYVVELTNESVLKAAFLVRQEQEPKFLPVLEATGGVPQLQEGDVVIVGAERMDQGAATRLKERLSDILGVEVYVLTGVPGLFEVVRPVK